MRFFGFVVGVLFAGILAGCASAPTPRPVSTAAAAPAEREVSAEEMLLLERYLEALTYGVYFREDSAEEPLLKDAALRAARSYVLAGGAVLAEEAEEVGVYIEIDAACEGETRGENHYGAAVVQCTIIEALTGVRLGVLRRPSYRTFSKASEFDAKANAVEAVLGGMIAEALAQTRGFLVNLYDGAYKNTEGSLFLNEVTNRILNPKK
jgi:hypothetical protein